MDRSQSPLSPLKRSPTPVLIDEKTPPYVGYFKIILLVGYFSASPIEQEMDLSPSRRKRSYASTFAPEDTGRAYVFLILFQSLLYLLLVLLWCIMLTSCSIMKTKV